MYQLLQTADPVSQTSLYGAGTDEHIAAATKDFDSQVAAELNVAKARVSAAEQRLNAASAATNERLAQLGIPSPPSAGQGDGR